MKGIKFGHIGLAICLLLLFGSLAIMFWPFIQTTRFWTITAFIIGLIGSMIFGIANTQNINSDENK